MRASRGLRAAFFGPIPGAYPGKQGAGPVRAVRLPRHACRFPQLNFQISSFLCKCMRLKIGCRSDYFDNNYIQGNDES